MSDLPQQGNGCRGFEFIDGLTWADCAFLAYAATLPALFINAAMALLSVMVENPENIDRSQTLTFEIQKGTLDLLLYGFLQEFLFFKDSRSLFMLPDMVVIDQTPDGYRLECTVSGEEIGQHQCRLLTDVKAITMHHLSITRTDEIWNARVVIDI